MFKLETIYGIMSIINIHYHSLNTKNEGT